MNNYMISLNSKKINILSQENYNCLLRDVSIPSLTCSCGHTQCLVRFGHYHRSIKTNLGILRICIQRLFCKECRKTHALLPTAFVPYSQVLFKDHLFILSASSSQCKKLMEDVPSIDESNLYYIRKKFQSFWKQRLETFSIALDHTSLVYLCFQHFHCQFMQRHPTINCLST